MAFCKVRPGHYAKARRLERVSFCLMIPALLGVLFASVFHDQFSDFVVASIRSQVVIDSPSSGAYPAFVDSSDPSAGQVVLSFYFFNITNAEDVVNNAAKPKVQEVGPLQYSYNNRKLNTTWDDDADVVRYVEYQYYTPLDSNTEWLQQQTITSLNVLLLAALSPAGGTADFVPVLYPSTKDPMALFARRTMAEMMWGYTDAVLPVPFPGLQHNDTSASYALQQHGVTSIYTGKRSGDKAWEYLEWDGIDSMQCCKAGPAGETGAGTSGGCGEAWGTWDAQAVSGVFGNRWHMGLDPSETLYLATYDFGIYRNWPLECRNVGGGPGPGWLSDGSDLTANIGSCDSYTVQDVSVLKFQLPDWILGNSSVSQAEAAGYGMASETVASVGADGAVAAASSGADLLSSSSSAAMWQQQTHVERKDESSASVQSTTASTSTTLRSASPQSAPVKAAASNVVQQTQKRRQQKQQVQVNQAPAPGSTPSGIMNQTKCEQYAPIFLSLPHFLYGSDVLRYAVDGVSPPDVDKHGSWMGVEPVTGTTLDFQFRIGINAHVTPILTHPLGSPFTYFPFIDDVTKKLNSTCGSGNRRGTSNAGSQDGDNVGSDGVCYGIDGIYWPLAWGELHSTADDYQGNVFKTQVYVGLKVLAALRWGGVVLAVVSVVAALLCRLAAARSHQRFANSEAGKRLIALDAAEGGSGADGDAYDLSNDANGYGGSLNAPLMLSMDDDRAVAGSSSNNNANVNGYRAAAKSDISREDSDPVLRQHRMANILPLTVRGGDVRS